MNLPLPPAVARRMITDGDFRERLLNRPRATLAEMGHGDNEALISRISDCDKDEVRRAIHQAISDAHGDISC